MKTQSLLTKIILGCSLGITLSFVLGWGQITFAQVNNSQDEYQSNEEDSFGTGSGNINPFDLIHRANQTKGRNAQEFDSDTDRNLQDSAAEFRRAQQQRIDNQSTPVSNPAKTQTDN